MKTYRIPKADVLDRIKKKKSHKESIEVEMINIEKKCELAFSKKGGKRKPC